MTKNTSEPQPTDPCADAVLETFHDDKMGGKVERVVRNGHDEDRILLKVYGKRTDRYARLDGEDTKEVTRSVKLTELTEQAATEVLFALAAAHGYELEEK